MKLPTIVLIRHGQTEWNVEGRYQGQLNSPLTEKGKLQAKQNAQKLARAINLDNPFKIYSSPLGRAKESCFLICDELGIDKDLVIFDDNIQEFNYGIFEGRTKEECREVYGRELAEREADKWSYVIEKGESYALVSNRLKEWLHSLSSDDVIVMVGHEMLNRALRGIYCQLKPKDMLLLRQPNDMVIKLKNREELIIN